MKWLLIKPSNTSAKTTFMPIETGSLFSTAFSIINNSQSQVKPFALFCLTYKDQENSPPFLIHVPSNPPNLQSIFASLKASNMHILQYANDNAYGHHQRIIAGNQC